MQAVQQLDRRDRVAVGVVGVRGDRQPREGQVGRGGLGAHVEQPAVVGLPHVAQAPGHGQHGPRLAGHLVQDDHAVGQHGRQARAAVLRVGQVARPPALRDPAAEVGCRPQALGVLGPVVILPGGALFCPSLPARVAVPGEPARGENRPVAVRAEDHFHGAVRCQDPRHGHVGREVGDGDEALPAARVPAAGARAVGAQPDRRQPPQRGDGPRRPPGLSHGPPSFHGHGNGASGARVSVSPARRSRHAPATASYQRECPGRRMPTPLAESS